MHYIGFVQVQWQAVPLGLTTPQCPSSAEVLFWHSSSMTALLDVSPVACRTVVLAYKAVLGPTSGITIPSALHCCVVAGSHSQNPKPCFLNFGVPQGLGTCSLQATGLVAMSVNLL